MKKRNILRASSALLIFAVLSFLSACEGVFEQYEPVGHLSSDYDTIYKDQDFEVKVLLSSRIKEPYSVLWNFLKDDEYISITEGIVDVKSDGKDFGKTPVPGQDYVTKRTTLTFTVKTVPDGVNKLFIEVRKLPNNIRTDQCVLTIGKSDD